MLSVDNNKVPSGKEKIDFGKWSGDDLVHILNTATHLKSAGERIEFISRQFLNMPYKEHTLTGSIHEQEIFTIDLSAVDCFTFIDYVEAMRLSRTLKGFRENLKNIRYQNGIIDYRKRNHFFTDWVEFNSANLHDASSTIGGIKTKTVSKIINLKDDGQCMLEGIAQRARKISYIPDFEIDKAVLERLKTGDYAGIYTELPGLDVSHTGIIVKFPSGDVFLRHASSLEKHRKVVEQPLKDYLSGKPGLIILRPLPI